MKTDLELATDHLNDTKAHIMLAGLVQPEAPEAISKAASAVIMSLQDHPPVHSLMILSLALASLQVSFLEMAEAEGND